MITTIVGTVKETFIIRKQNSPEILNLEGIIAILIVTTFVITCILQSVGMGVIPNGLQNIMGVVTGWFFRGGYERQKQNNGKGGSGGEEQVRRTTLEGC